MKQLLLLLLALPIYCTATAQTDCKVSTDNLKGQYSGGCSGGKAHGAGVAVGIDKYEGGFANGYPEGTGVYHWKDSSFYTGSWKKGGRDGKGSMHYKDKNGNDSLVSGFWKKDKYIGKYEHQYILHSLSSGMSKVNCSIVKKGGNSITIRASQISNSGGIASNGGIPLLESIITTQGTFQNRYTQNLNNSQVVTLTEVVFPFRAIFYYRNGAEQTEITFNEQAEYTVDIVLF